LIGETISHYRIIDQLGKGGMGVVYLAEDLTLGRRVAIKFLSTTTKEYRARFLREARAVSALSHPNIATVFDYGETAEGQPYIVMELIQGEPLNEKLREGSLPLREAVRIVSFIAEALGEAHHHGVVHRDVKPSNVVITERGLVKVLDFGLVKQIAEQSGGSDQKTLPSTRTRSDVIVGTPLYLSPEQATGKNIDGRSDLFALGVVLYECLTGQSAFAGGSIIEIGAQVIHVTPVVPSKLNNRIPAELNRITMKAIEKKVEDRYQTAAEFVADLQRVLPNLADDGYRQGGRSTGTVPRQRTNSASALTTITETFRKPGPPLGIVIVAIAVVALLGWLIISWLRPGVYVPNARALTMYDQGTDALRYGAFLQATKALDEAVKLDPKFAMAHARLAEAWFELDYADRAKDEMLKARPVGETPSSLSETNALALEAIQATVTHDFPGAIKAHTEIARLAPKDAPTHVDLGRAYEKNDQLQQALDSYFKATELAPEHPTAFLRLGIMYGKQINLKDAFAAFDRADMLYQAVGNVEGQAEVAYQRGFVLNQNDRFQEAEREFKRALELALPTKSEYQEVKSRLKLGEVITGEGHPDEGRAMMQQAIDLARSREIDNYVKRGLVDLGNTYMLSRDYPKAEEYFRESLELAQKQKDPRNVARALLSLGSALERQNRLEEALDCVDRSRPFYERGGYRREATQAFAVKARAKKKQGEYDVALKMFEEELQAARLLNDQALIAQATVDVAGVLMNQSHYPEALVHFEEGYNLAKASNYQSSIGLHLTNRANMLWSLGRYPEAKPLMDEASRLLPDLHGRGFTNWYYVSVARRSLSERQFDQAQKNARTAMDSNPAGITETYLLGLAQLLSGSTKEGRLNCETAAGMLTPTSDPLTAAEVKMALAQALLQTGDSAGALPLAVEVAQTFARLGKQDFQWLAWLLAARASKNAGEAQQARDYALQAESLRAGLEQRWGNENYQGYLNRPDIKFYQDQLSELLAPKP
jgi:tetratricopeptide (TPR) repeat protein/predicted Ser/Thr protein kinase